jgi:hypothetical protein
MKMVGMDSIRNDIPVCEGRLGITSRDFIAGGVGGTSQPTLMIGSIQ